jgi:hypothetical protein
MKWDEGKEYRYQQWLIQFDIWCKKHELTRVQGAGILSETGVNSWRSLFWPSGEDEDFMHKILKEHMK